MVAVYNNTHFSHQQGVEFSEGHVILSKATEFAFCQKISTFS